MRFHLIRAAAVFFCATSMLSAQTYDPMMGSRLTDPLFRTGETFALVVKNYYQNSIRVNVLNDPNFFMHHTSSLQGAINVPGKKTAYRVFYKKAMGIPRYEQQSAESVSSDQALLVNRDVFDGLTGTNFHPDIQITVSGPGSPICKNVFPKYDHPTMNSKIPLSYMNVDESFHSASVIYVTVLPSGTECLAEFKSVDDSSWLDGGPAPVVEEETVEVTIPAMSPYDHVLLDFFDQAAPFAGMVGYVSGTFAVIPLMDAAKEMERTMKEAGVR